MHLDHEISEFLNNEKNSGTANLTCTADIFFSASQIFSLGLACLLFGRNYSSAIERDYEIITLLYNCSRYQERNFLGIWVISAIMMQVELNCHCLETISGQQLGTIISIKTSPGEKHSYGKEINIMKTSYK